jgi:NADH dehydrogenase (ubiquinone) Fe-S protein 1
MNVTFDGLLSSSAYNFNLRPFTKAAKMDDATPLGSSVVNFYMTDAISRASATMAKCTKAKAADAAMP